jgi:FMN phosphatase YigB (HAD superfamily)
MGLAALIDVVVPSKQFGQAKPASDIFRYTFDKLGVDLRDSSVAELCCHVGDDLKKDYLAARKMGIQARLVQSGSLQEADLRHPHSKREVNIEGVNVQTITCLKELLEGAQ